MGNRQSNIREGRSSSQRSAANSNIRGHTSNNIVYSRGSSNIIGAGISYSGNVGSTNSAENYTKILECLFTSDYRSHRNRIREPVEGSCTWVTQHPKYMDWLERETSGLLWLSADPGCGKSVIASFLVRHLKIHTDAIVCYFFFKDDNDEQRSAASALCAILHQLFVQRSSLCKYAEEAFQANAKGFTGEVDSLWGILVRAVADGECGDVICVVDALDECDDSTLPPLIRHIARLPRLQGSDIPLKFLVTSRPYHNIARELGSPSTTIRLKGEDEVNAITSDVNRVIDEGIENLESYWEQAGKLEYLRIILKSSADRTFLWVSLVLEILKNSVDDSPEEFTNIVSTAPYDLAELYTKILNESPHPAKARRILNIVVAAARPLTLREMNVAFRISRDHKTAKSLQDLPLGFERTVKNLCGHFVRVIDSKIYLVHQTAREFLVKGSLAGQGDWQYTLRPKDSNFIMADICIAYLSLEDFENDPLAGGNFSGATAQEVGNYLQKYALLRYAASHWAGHFRDSQDWEMELFNYTRVICRGRSNRFLTWFLVYWLDSGQYHPFPEDFTHLMTASWFGQGYTVERLLEEGGDTNARSTQYGTALNIAALRKDESITRLLLQRNVKAYIGGEEYNILHTKRSELEMLEELDRREIAVIVRYRQ